jgi:hypothetical protein
MPPASTKQKKKKKNARPAALPDILELMALLKKQGVDEEADPAADMEFASVLAPAVEVREDGIVRPATPEDVLEMIALERTGPVPNSPGRWDAIRLRPDVEIRITERGMELTTAEHRNTGNGQ